MNPLEAHPGEGSQEEEVEDPGDDGAPDLGFRQSWTGEIMGSISIRWQAFIQINSAARKGFLRTKRSVGFVENCISCAGYFMTCRAVIAWRLANSHLSAKVWRGFHEYSSGRTGSDCVYFSAFHQRIQKKKMKKKKKKHL